NQLNELIKRRAFIIQTIEEQGQLTKDLKQQLENCWEEVELEDLYLPYKKKRKTKATVAKELGLEPLANLIWKQEIKDVKGEARRFVKGEVTSSDQALEGARDIIAERISEDTDARNLIRKLFRQKANFSAKVVKSKKEEAAKYSDYFDSEESASRAPAHRVLAMLRGEKEGLLRVKLSVDKEDAFFQLKRKYVKSWASYACREQLEAAITDAYARLLGPGIETEFRKIYKEKADEEAIRVFSENLKQLLLAPPLGNKRIMGIDPGFRTGCKVVCLDEHGNLLENTTIYPHPPQNKQEEAQKTIEHLAHKYELEAIAIGNGTAGKESYAFIKSINLGKQVEAFMVNESGASIYSASEIARKEFPDHDITVRGAVSIARRLMDPLSELVKIDPKSIGVGQYQHDVNQTKLKADLDRCVESCVNLVGINLNTASEHVLTYISGLGPTLAKNIVDYRAEHGSFEAIEQLKNVPRMGEKAFEQSAGFLRIRDGKNPLDNTGVHPERYSLVKIMAKDLRTDVPSLIQNGELRKTIQPNKYINTEVGLPTINDILAELAKPA
ncbi:MAG: Tex-like N-terminal domain-containing protein, partial [Chitinophagales bacterium]